MSQFEISTEWKYTKFLHTLVMFFTTLVYLPLKIDGKKKTWPIEHFAKSPKVGISMYHSVSLFTLLFPNILFIQEIGKVFEKNS